MAQLAREVVLGATEYNVPQHFTSPSFRRSFQGRSAASLLPDIEQQAEAPLLPEAAAGGQGAADLPPEHAGFVARVRVGINLSWAVNVLLLVSKVTVFVLSGSVAVLASAIDSLVDLLSQAVLAVAEYQAARFDQRFPIGRTRMAELSVLACAAIMFVSTVLVIRESLGSLWDGLHGRPPVLVVDATLFAVLGGATAAKLALYLYCVALRKNPIMVALSEDHLNDVMSNVAAVAGAAIAGNLPKFWFADPAVAIAFSLLIIYNWLKICYEQGQKMVGLGAPEELIAEVQAVTASHHAAMQLDRVTAYHHGSHMVVEVEVLLPADMTVRESHDIALALQHKIEALDSVERAFVHVDYARRPLEEHKVERNLKLGVRDVMKPLVGFESFSPGSLRTTEGGAAWPDGAGSSGARGSASPSISTTISIPGGGGGAAAAAAPSGTETQPGLSQQSSGESGV